jgi:hypothetical protein
MPERDRADSSKRWLGCAPRGICCKPHSCLVCDEKGDIAQCGAFPIAPAISVQFETVIDRHAPGNSSFYPIIESARQPTEQIQIAA